MPVWIGDYLADTQRLTTEQHGAYLLLIFDYWRNGPPPDSDDTLRSICKLDAGPWRRHRPILERMFQVRDGAWHHKRIDAELESARDNQDRRTSKARNAASARWSNASSDAPSMPDALVGECPSPSPSPIVSEPIGSDTKRGRAPSSAPDKPDDVSERVWTDWQVHRKAKKAPITATVIDRFRSEAAKARMTLDEAIAMSCARGWQGFEAKFVEGDRGGSRNSSNGAGGARSGGDGFTRALRRASEILGADQLG